MRRLLDELNSRRMLLAEKQARDIWAFGLVFAEMLGGAVAGGCQKYRHNAAARLASESSFACDAAGLLKMAEHLPELAAELIVARAAAELAEGGAEIAGLLRRCWPTRREIVRQQPSAMKELVQHYTQSCRKGTGSSVHAQRKRHQGCLHGLSAAAA